MPLDEINKRRLIVLRQQLKMPPEDAGKNPRLFKKWYQWFTGGRKQGYESEDGNDPGEESVDPGIEDTQRE